MSREELEGHLRFNVRHWRKKPRTGGNIVGQDDEGLFVQFSRSVPVSPLRASVIW